jgi:hypothetical protein
MVARRLILAVVVVAGCTSHGKSGAAAAPPLQIIQAVSGWADRACQCGTDPHCIEPIRAEWDAAKYEHQKVWDQLPPADRKRYDDALGRFRACGDAAGLTIWMP